MKHCTDEVVKQWVRLSITYPVVTSPVGGRITIALKPSETIGQIIHHLPSNRVTRGGGRVTIALKPGETMGQIIHHMPSNRVTRRGGGD